MRRTTFLASALLLLIVANVLMMTYASPMLRGSSEGFANHVLNTNARNNEGFQNYNGNPGGAKGAYQPIGPYDSVKLNPGNGSSWRYTAPNEPLRGLWPKFEPGPDSLFMFRDNQCKPECCGASFACDGGCVCTTPDQRKFINERGGNRTSPDADPGV